MHTDIGSLIGCPPPYNQASKRTVCKQLFCYHDKSDLPFVEFIAIRLAVNSLIRFDSCCQLFCVDGSLSREVLLRSEGRNHHALVFAVLSPADQS